MRRGLIAGTAAVVVALAVGIGVSRIASDPLAALPREATSRVAVVEEALEPWQGRTLLHVALEGEAVGRVRFVVSLPDPMPPWPLPSREPGTGEIVRRLPEFRRKVLTVPGQVDAILAWASRQAWADPDRVSLLGFSLGAFVVPAAQRLAQDRGASVRWTILGYAGAPIGAVIAGHPKAGPPWIRPALGTAADLLLRPVEPSHHLPHLRGRFLVLRAANDRLIVRAAAERFAELTPEPRTVVRIEGDHMGLGDKWKLLAHVIDVSRSWLLEQGAIDPARSGTVHGRVGW